MTEPWTDEIEQLHARLGSLIERAEFGVDTHELVAEALEELAVVVEELQAQNSELIASRSDLEHERERYRDLFETVPDGYVVTDTQGIIREINTTGAQLFGKPRHRLVGTALGLLIVSQDRRAFYGQLSRLQAEGPGAQLNINLMIRDHAVFPATLHASLATTRTNDGHEIRWLIHDRSSDLSNRRIQASEERLRALFDTAPVGIMLTDLGGTVIFANQHADQLLDRAPADIDLDLWLASVHPDDRPRVRAALEDSGRHNSTATMRYRIRTADEICWIEHGFTPFPAMAEKPDGVLSTMTDVTAETRAREGLESERDFIDAVLQTVGALVIVLAPDGRVERFNRACEQVSGFDADSIIGRHVVDVLVPEDQRDGVEHVIKNQERTHENDWVAADGGRRTIQWTNTVLHHDDGTVQVMIGTGMDVTETQRLEQRLAQVARLESIGRLAAGLAHDFNNTLATIQLRLDRVIRRNDISNRDDIDAAMTTIDRTRELVSDLVTFSGQQRLSPQPTDVNAETRRMTTLLDDLLGESITIRLDLTDEPAIAFVDRGSLEQVITNLILNARDAMPTGGSVTVATRVEHVAGEHTLSAGELESGTYVRLTVTDTGTGIEPQHMPHIFDPYFTTKPPTKGTGLGLATAHGTLTQSGGAIDAESTPGRGSTFTLWLPDGAESAPAAARIRDPARSEGGRLVLVVEDDPEVCEAVVEEVRQLDHETLTAASGEDALGHIDAPIDLLITDVQLPTMNGAQLAARFNEKSPDTAVLYISGATPSALGAILPRDAHLLAKPFTAEQLAAAVDRALDVADSSHSTQESMGG